MALHNDLTADLKSDLYGRIPSDGEVVTLMGNTVRGDMPPLFYIYDSASSSADNFPSVIKPTLQTGSGRWLNFYPLQIQTDYSQANSGEMNFLKNKPILSAVATSGSYTDLSNQPSIPVVPANYNAGGAINITKRWMALVTPNTGNGYSVDISSASFNVILSIAVTPVKNTAVPTSVPKVGIKSYSTSNVVLNIIEGNANTVNILSSVVLLGTSEAFANVSGLTVWVVVEGN